VVQEFIILSLGLLASLSLGDSDASFSDMLSSSPGFHTCDDAATINSWREPEQIEQRADIRSVRERFQPDKKVGNGEIEFEGEEPAS
jgi:hypothetical protein